MPYAGLSLEGQVALVTGSARGIGKALAIGLAEAGAEVAVSDIPSMLDDARTTQQLVEGKGKTSRTYPLDVLDVANIQGTVNQVVTDFGRLDILVNNAGIRVRRLALEVTPEDWDAVIDTNLKGTFFCAQAAARHMVDQGGGRIIN
jgi:2-deoxy-D-gluconate 3-dehydrogenase